MKNFIIRIVFFILLYLIIGRLISLITPYHWGNPWYSTKIQYLEKFKSNNLPNTYFFGSSRVYRQIMPTVFDSTYFSLSKKHINSFNLGAPATFCPQVYYLYENFLSSSLSQNTKYVFIELMDIDLIEKNLMHQERVTYWINLSDIFFGYNALHNNPSISLATKTKYISNYSISYLENLLHMGHFGQQYLDNNYYNLDYLGEHKNGFFSLERDTATTKNETFKNQLIDRNKDLIADTSELKNRAINSTKDFSNKNLPLDVVHLERINKLINLSKEKGISIVFILSPRNNSQNLINLYNAIPENNKIQLSNSKKYPELYMIENSFDIGHLNTKGSSIYSSLLATEFNKLLTDKEHH